MFRKRGKREAVVDALASAGPRAGQVLEEARHALEDAKLRERVRKAAAHGLAARREARRRGPLQQLARNRRLHFHVREMTRNLQKAKRQTERKRRRRRIVRTALVVAPAAALAVPQSRHWLFGLLNGAEPHGRKRIEEEIDIDVPVSTAYNQWTQFEEFPLFMEGVDDVRQLDDTKLRWTASIGGNRAEWEAKILEQVPDSRIVWASTDGKDTRGTVTFESLGPERTRVRLQLGYTPEGLGETVGSAAGLDSRRVRGDLDRFKELIESRGVADGAWRGEIREGDVVR
jgi:uncharacterized membrane protein